MNFPWEIKDKRILVIPDYHQDVNWVKAILVRESGNYDHLIQLGDEFDSFDEPPKVASVTETAIFQRDLLYGKYGPSTILMGNHSLSYAESAYQLSKGYTVKHLFNACSGYTNNKAKKIYDVLKGQDWQKFNIFCVANGWLCSHAGFRQNNWRPFLNIDGNLEKLYEECRLALDLLPLKGNDLFRVGFARGGSEMWGGPLWMDFDLEFEDILPIKQLVGHTCNRFIRKIGQSYCIDTNQSSYAIIQSDGSIAFKRIFKSISGEWIESTENSPINYDKIIEARYQSVNQNLIDGTGFIV